MESQVTLGDIYEEIAERFAQARTRALQGEREEALAMFEGASLEFTRFRAVMQDYPGYAALEHAFLMTLGALQKKTEEEDEQ